MSENDNQYSTGMEFQVHRSFIQISEIKEREGQVLSLLVLGYDVNDIAAELDISVNYTYHLIRSLRMRFLAKTNAAMVSRAIAEGMVSANGELLRKAQNADTTGRR